MFLSLTRVPCSDLLEMCIILNIYFSLYTIMFCKVLKHKQNIRTFWGKEANTNTICSPVSLFALSSSSRNKLLHQCVSYHITTSSSWGIKAHFSYHSLCNLSNYVSFSCSVVHVFFSWHAIIDFGLLKLSGREHVIIDFETDYRKHYVCDKLTLRKCTWSERCSDLVLTCRTWRKLFQAFCCQYDVIKT